MDKKVDKATPFWDASLTDDQRIDWLLSAMTIDEKLDYLSSQAPDLDRLGIPGFSVGGEAAHGVVEWSVQNDMDVPDVTTSFPQPIGMSAAWDTELIRKAGQVTGTEARVIYHRHPGRGLSRWAPTVDLERDPRWGRNEEGYGEDPVLTGAMAGAYIKGMQGEDPKYIRTAATLKHFYGNNTEVGRGWKSSSIDPRNQYELYLEPFRRCIEDAKAEGVMTAYNKINGTVGILNPEVDNILKKQYGLKHVVGDGAAMGLVVSLHHHFGQHAETIAAALKAGVDAMSDDPVMVEQAAREAYELNLITEADADRAIRNMMRTKLRLGIYDREPGNPFDRVTEADIDSEENRAVCMQLTREAVILLKNENHMLPLDLSMNVDDMVLAGPLGDAWYQDWYGGLSPYRKTFRQGLREIQKTEISFADGLDRIVFRYQEKGAAIAEDGTLYLADEPDIFVKENWGEGSYTFKSVRTGKYLNTRLPMPGKTDEEMGRIAADNENAFDWFVLEIFHIEENENGTIVLTNRFNYPVCIDENGAFVATQDKNGSFLRMDVVESGIEKAAALAAKKKIVLLALGCNSMINAKEEIDRKTLTLPLDQQRLLDEVAKVNPNTVLVLFTNYPYTMNEAQEKLPAIVTSATGSQDMGTAMAETIFGLNAPAGRLNMTWYKDVSQLPDIDDYDIMKGKRTYRYFDGEVLYPFGFGLTYTDFTYADFSVKLKDYRTLDITFMVTNTGNTASDEVAQVYGKAPASRVKKPICQLLGFVRLKNLAPGEKRTVSMEIPVEELRFYDVISRTLMVEEGIYQIYAGPNSKAEAIKLDIFVPGRKTGLRDMSKRIPADHYDDYENIYLTEGHFGFKAAALLEPEKPGCLIYKDCDLTKENRVLSLHVKSEKGGKIKVYLNDRLAGSWEGETRTYERQSAPKLDKNAWQEVIERNKYRVPLYEDLDIVLDGIEEQNGPVKIKLCLEGDIKLCFLRGIRETTGGRINLGVAN